MIELLVFISLFASSLFAIKKWFIPQTSKHNNHLSLKKDRGRNLKMGAILSMSFFLIAFNLETMEGVIDDIEEPMDTLWMIDQAMPITMSKPLPELPKVTETPKHWELKPVELIEEVVHMEPKNPINDIEDIDPLEIEEVPDEPEEILDFPPVMPEFRNGGQGGLIRFINKHLRIPNRAYENDASGTVIIQFVIEKDGSVSNAEIRKGIGSGCDEEALRVIEAMPNWKPGRHRGRNVRTRMKIPIRFKISS